MQFDAVLPFVFFWTTNKLLLNGIIV